MRDHSMTSRLAVGCSFFSLALTAGCANLGEVIIFARSTKQVVDSSERFAGIVRERDVELASSFGVSQYDTLEALGDDHDLKLASLKRLDTALAALRTYAVGLEEIATLNQDNEIEAAAKSLAGALGSVARSSGLPATDVLATAIAEVAKAILAIKQRKAVRSAALNAGPHVNNILTALENEINALIGKRGEIDQIISDAQLGTTFEIWAARYQQLDEQFAARYAQYVNASEAERRKLAEQMDGILLEQAALRESSRGLIGIYLEEKYSDSQEEVFLAALRRTVMACREAHGKIATDEFDLDAAVKLGEEAAGLANALRRLGG